LYIHNVPLYRYDKRKKKTGEKNDLFFT